MTLPAHVRNGWGAGERQAHVSGIARLDRSIAGPEDVAVRLARVAKPLAAAKVEGGGSILRERCRLARVQCRDAPAHGPGQGVEDTVMTFACHAYPWTGGSVHEDRRRSSEACTAWYSDRTPDRS